MPPPHRGLLCVGMPQAKALVRHKNCVYPSPHDESFDPYCADLCAGTCDVGIADCAVCAPRWGGACHTTNDPILVDRWQPRRYLRRDGRPYQRRLRELSHRGRDANSASCPTRSSRVIQDSFYKRTARSDQCRSGCTLCPTSCAWTATRLTFLNCQTRQKPQA